MIIMIISVSRYISFQEAHMLAVVSNDFLPTHCPSVFCCIVHVFLILFQSKLATMSGNFKSVLEVRTEVGTKITKFLLHIDIVS